MTRAPYVMLKSGEPWNRSAPQVADSTVGWRFVNPEFSRDWTISLGETAERVAERHGIGRADQDRFAAESQRRAACAQAEGAFDDELVPVTVKDGKTATVVERDEHPRPDVTVESLARLKPAFKPDGTVTAGSSSGINDGAAAVLVMDSALAKQRGYRPLARVVASAVAGVAPDVMGIGPIPAVRKVLHRARLRTSDLDLVELNEAFAAQALACIRELELDEAKVNVHGGAIALGHPLGASGARMIATLTHAMKRRGARYGLATMCIGVGQGIAMIVERHE
jgi:acetyl-CoA C-acetyltransferase/3-oxo-5,6-didehydrosuberyl-CoA/3-oxoadipyl-CoA thiolase